MIRAVHPEAAPLELRAEVLRDRAYEYRNETTLEWAKQFHARVFIREPALRVIAEKMKS